MALNATWSELRKVRHVSVWQPILLLQFFNCGVCSVVCVANECRHTVDQRVGSGMCQMLFTLGQHVLASP